MLKAIYGKTHEAIRRFLARASTLAALTNEELLAKLL